MTGDGLSVPHVVATATTTDMHEESNRDTG